MDRNRRNIALFYLVFFLQGMVFYSPVATLYRQAAGLSLLQIGLIEGLSLGLAMVLEIPWGRWADRLGHRRTLVLCCMLFALTKVIFWRADSFGGFLAERLLLAVVMAGLSGCDSAFLYACCSGDHRRAFSRWEAVQTAGILVSALVWPLLGGNYRLAALLTVGSYGVAAILALGWREPQGAAALCGSREAAPTLKTLLRQTWKLAPLLLALCLLEETAQMGTVFLNQLQYLRAGIDLRWFGALQAVVTAAGLMGGLSYRLLRRMTARRAMVLLLGTGAAACTAMALWAAPAVSVAGIMALRAVKAMAVPIALSEQNECAAGGGGAAAQLSCNAMLMELGAVALNPAFGAFADRGVQWALALGVVCCAAGAGAAALFRSPRTDTTGRAA